MKWITLLMVFSYLSGIGQDIPVGQWRSHLSYRNVIDIAETGERTYALTSGGLFYVDREDNSLEKLSSVNGLRRAGVTAIGRLNDQQIIVGYDGGEIDIISETEIIMVDDIVRASFPDSEKGINHIHTSGTSFYVSTGFGIVVFNSNTLKVKETYWQLDTDGASLEVYSATTSSTMVVLATNKGLMVGDMNDNLLDFNQWDRYYATGIAHHVSFYVDMFYATVDGSGLYSFDGLQWNLVDFPGQNFLSLVSGAGHLWIGMDSGLVKWTNSSTESINLTEGSGTLGFSGADREWVGSDNGLYSISGSSFIPFIPDGPFAIDNWSVDYINNTITVLSGGFNIIYTPLNRNGGLYLLNASGWQNYNQTITPALTNFTDPVQISWSSSLEKYVISCFDIGLYTFDGADFELLDVPSSMGPRLSAVYADEDGLWVVDSEGSPSLYHLDNLGNWNSFSISGTPPFLAKKMVSDRNYLYILLDPTFSGEIIMIDKLTGLSRSLDTETNQGDFPGIPTSIDIDLQNRIWVGTSNGVAYFNSTFIEDPINSFTPISEFSPLLRGRRVNDVEVDAGNRKWFATDDGVFLMDERGEEVINQFNEANSPLLSDVVSDIAVNNKSGEVFFITDKGLISYRGDATTAQSNLSQVKIFPNPVLPEFKGLVTIEGLVNDSEVKITDVSGNLIWESISSGGSLSWDIRNQSGDRPATGIYFVFMSDRDGIETFVGKLAIIR